MKTKIEIKSISGKVLFEYEKENNTIKDTLEEAMRKNADLRRVSLCGADLRKIDFYGVDLREANLDWTNLCEVDLREANLDWADLRRANLYGANLSGATLYEANLSGADLREANLYKANLSEADLRGAYLYGAKNIPYIPINCPSDGVFIAWKKVRNKLVKLEIPEDAKRSSATTTKCRCDKAKVLAITDWDGANPIDEIENISQAHHVTYKVGEIVYPDSFDEDRWNECSHGIHFFVNKQDAINY